MNERRFMPSSPGPHACIEQQRGNEVLSTAWSRAVALEKQMKVIAFERNLQGTGASRRLRNTGKTPGIVYCASSEPQLIELDHNALWHALKKEVFHSSILDLEVAGKSQQVLLRDVQYHPFRQLVLHVDFQRVDAKKKLHTKVPLHFMNQETNPAVKLSGAVISHVVTELEVECL